MNKIKQSLTRKLGPLPVWAWALISGAALYVYRTRRDIASGNLTTAAAVTPSQSNTDATGGTDSGSGGGGQPPITLGPGESVYDPNTGHLIGTAPEQQFPAEPAIPPTPLDPLVLQPGEGVYDPNSGTLMRNAAPAATTTQTARKTKPGFHKGHSRGHDYFLAGVGWVSKARYQGSKRGKSPKAQHAPKTHVTKPGNHKGKARSPARLLKGIRRPKAITNPPKGRARGGGSAATPKPRVRAQVKRTPAIRQHPATHTAPRRRTTTTHAAPLPAHRTEHKAKRTRTRRK